MTDQATVASRKQFRAAILANVLERAEDRATTMDGGPLDGLLMMSIGVLGEVLDAVAADPLPPVSDTHAEVRTPATVAVSAHCPRCDMPGLIQVSIDAELRIDARGAELHVKAKAKHRAHTCGQMELPEATTVAEGQLALDDIVVPRCGRRTDGWEADWSCMLPADHEGECEPAGQVVEDAIAEEDDEDGAGEAPERQQLARCDFPGCVMYAFHSGDHESEAGDPLEPVEYSADDVQRLKDVITSDDGPSHKRSRRTRESHGFQVIERGCQEPGCALGEGHDGKHLPTEADKQ